MSNKQLLHESDARPTAPSFDELVLIIKKLFTDYLEDFVKSKPSEIKKSWERYKTLNHLYQDTATAGDTFLLNRLGITLENIYRIHSVQWNEYDRLVIRGILDQWEQSKKDAGPVNEAKDVFVPCAEDDPETCGSYTSHDGRSLCYVKVKHIPTAQLTQERADLIREANNRDLEGMVKATDTVTINMVNMNEVEKLKDENKRLNQWKKEAIQIINPLMEYAQGHKDAKLGGSCVDFILNRCKGFDDLKAKGDKLSLAARRLSLTMKVHPDYEVNSEFYDRVEGVYMAELEWSGEAPPAKGGMPKLDEPIISEEEFKAWEEGKKEEKTKCYTDEEIRDIISMVCDQLNEDFEGREHFIDQTLAAFAGKKADIDRLRKMGVKHPNPYLCDYKEKCGYPGCGCLPF